MQVSFYARTELQITEQPQSNTSIKYGQAVTLSVSATGRGAENLVYLWKKDGQYLCDKMYIGTNTPTLTISEFLPDHQGKYACEVNSSIESEQADLALGLFISIVLSLYLIIIVHSIYRFPGA